MADTTITLCRVVLMGALLASTGACARPLGDFSRAQPGTLHDDILPAIGRGKSELEGKPVSDFNLTDQEREMHDRVWRFLVSQHAQDWSFDFSAEMQRTRIGVTDDKFRTDRYYKWISGESFASSRVRYATLTDDARSDIATMPSTFRAICAVIEVDRQRELAARSVADLDPKVAQERRDRKAENEAQIGWFVRAASYRYQSYDFALTQLLVETPHEEAVAADAELSDLAGWIDRALGGDFCGGQWAPAQAGAARIPSRVMMAPPSEGEYRK